MKESNLRLIKENTWLLKILRSYPMIKETYGTTVIDMIDGQIFSNEEMIKGDKK